VFFEDDRVFYERFELRTFSNGERGLFARVNFRKGEDMLVVPEHYMLTTQRIQAEMEWLPKGLSLQAQFGLFIFFQQSNSSSPWNVFLDTLPKNYDNIPLTFQEDLLALLEGTNAKELLLKTKKDLHEDYAQILQALPKFPLSFEQFVTYTLYFSTRNFSIRKKGIGKSQAMVPILDMTNHVLEEYNTMWFYDN